MKMVLIKLFHSFLFFFHLFSLANGCELIYNQIGIHTLFDLCRYACQTTVNEGIQLRMITLGALHNIINSNGKF
jgi:hypothetical protein